MVEGIRIGGNRGLLGVLKGCCPCLPEILEDIENSITGIPTCMSLYIEEFKKDFKPGSTCPVLPGIHELHDLGSAGFLRLAYFGVHRGRLSLQRDGYGRGGDPQDVVRYAGEVRIGIET